ncbi:MarR family winged helix-turn-helix transcriptional regulator [Brachybacterium tyrofermentans]|uniref:MarR family winged helix-turn-helix transcriptional regulator n=1 Tax=Brachybacterium tyrofermentans TaxID=47848 RepID=UPI003F92BA69
MSTPSSRDALPPDALAERLAEVYVAIGPVYRRVARIVEHDGHSSGLSVGVRNVLDQLRRRGELTVPQLAHEQDLSRQFVQRMVHDARGADLVELVENPAHRRSSLVRITPAGQEAIGAVIEREHELMGRVGGHLTAAELEATVRVLRHMDAALVEIEDERDRP